MVVDEVDGQLHTFAHEQSTAGPHVEAFADEYQGRPTPAMGRFTGKREWETLLPRLGSGRRDQGSDFVRVDGKTLVPQPHLRFDDKEMWTLDDVRGHTLQVAADAAARDEPGRPREAPRRISHGLHDQPLQLSSKARVGPHACGLRCSLPALVHRQHRRSLGEFDVREPLTPSDSNRSGSNSRSRRARPSSNAAFRQGIALPHGCKEGQCSACKCEPRRGRGRPAEILDLRAAPTARARRATSCSAGRIAYSDIEIELLNFDEELLPKSIAVKAFPGPDHRSVTPLTHDIRLHRDRARQPR